MNVDLDEYLLEARLICEAITEKEECEFMYVCAIATRKKDKLQPDQLVKLWCIGIKTAKITLEAITHQCIRTVGNLTKRFRTDRAHL